MSHQAQMLAAIQAISDGRFSDAIETCEQLIENPLRAQPGRCNYCGCSDGQACGIVVVLEKHGVPTVIRCSWINDEQTVCSRLTCVQRYEAEQQEAAALTAPLIVTP